MPAAFPRFRFSASASRCIGAAMAGVTVRPALDSTSDTAPAARVDLSLGHLHRDETFKQRAAEHTSTTEAIAAGQDFPLC